MDANIHKKSETYSLAVFKWLDARNYIDRKSRPGKLASHRFMDGSNLYVPMHHNDAFLQELVKDLLFKYPICTSECATKIYKAFEDIDCLELEPPSLIYILSIAKCACKSMSFFVAGDFQVIASVSDYEHLIQDDGTILFKYGIHLVFPDVQLSHELMIYYDEMFTCDLEALLGKRQSPLNSVRKMIDPGVHNSPTDTKIRMNKNWKANSCKQCEKRKERDRKAQEDANTNGTPYIAKAKKQCDVIGCCGGKIYKESVYSALFILNENGDLQNEALASMKKNILFELQATSIRTSLETPRADFIIPVNAPSPLREFNHETGQYKITKLDENGDLKQNDANVKRLIGKNFSQLTDIELKSSIGVDIINNIHENTISHWSEVTVRKIKQGIDKAGNPLYIIDVSGAGANFCLNVTPDNKGCQNHSASFIYFMVTISGLYQKCRCKNSKSTLDERRQNLRCSTYTSDSIPLNDELSNKLFPNIDYYLGDINTNAIKLSKITTQIRRNVKVKSLFTQEILLEPKSLSDLFNYNLESLSCLPKKASTNRETLKCELFINNNVVKTIKKKTSASKTLTLECPNLDYRSKRDRIQSLPENNKKKTKYDEDEEIDVSSCGVALSSNCDIFFLRERNPNDILSNTQQDNIQLYLKSHTPLSIKQLLTFH